jgi:hypothetical protein
MLSFVIVYKLMNLWIDFSPLNITRHAMSTMMRLALVLIADKDSAMDARASAWFV